MLLNAEPAGESPAEKEKRYARLLAQALSLLEDGRRVMTNLANLSALLAEGLPGLNWAGFYLVEGGELYLGPFQGRVACTRIPFGRGVCGAAAQSGETQIVPDVHRFPGHIACDGASRSEIVVPLRSGGRVAAVLDLDSPLLGRFDEGDARGLMRIAEAAGLGCDWEKFRG